ncbi:kinase-like domain-containing protein [Dichotomocladium elegans]|nr:kinase-like domain-containing protein [Dichotomocladium elegans]
MMHNPSVHPSLNNGVAQQQQQHLTAASGIKDVANVCIKDTGHGGIKDTANVSINNNKRKHQDFGAVDKDDTEDGSNDLGGYQKLHKIGEGTYGVVFKARQKLTNKVVALKKIRLNHSDGMPVTTMREIAILKELKHRNVLGLKDLVQRPTTVYLVTEYLDMDLRRYMLDAGREGLTADHIKSYMHQLLSGLHYCHSHRILHRDLKPQNLLLDRQGRLVIADLGLSRAFGIPMRTYTHQVITLWYRPPEILLGSRYYSTAVDMWSVGCIFVEMMIMRPIFPGDSQIDQLFRIFRILGTPNEDLWAGVTMMPDFNLTFPIWKPRDLKETLQRYSSYLELNDLALNLLKQLLDYDPCYRLSARKALEHPYFYSDITKLKF